MGNKIFYIIDNFCPTALYDQAIIKNDAFYVIVNTYLIRNGDDFNECPAITDYINPATQAANYTWEYLPANTKAMQIAANEPDRVIPIPPPLNIRISFIFNGETIDNKLGFEFSSEGEKIDWIRQSNSSIVVRLTQSIAGINYFDYISYPQLVSYNKWFTALLTDVFRKKQNDISDSLEKEIWNCTWTGEDPVNFRESFIKKIETEQGNIPANKPLPLGIQHFYLARYCSFLTAKNTPSTSPFAPDPLKFGEEAMIHLSRIPSEAKAVLGADANYRRIICQLLSSEKDPANVIERLQFFYGTGERVRIKGDAGISIMVIKDIDTPQGLQLNPDKTVTDYKETNAYSLCGQVAAIPLTKVLDPSFENTFTIQAGSMSLISMLSNSDRKDYFDSVKAYIDNTNQNDHTKFQRTLTLPERYHINPTTTVPQEKTNYYPVNALLDHNFSPYAIRIDPDTFGTAIKLPEALLDNLLENPRVSYDKNNTFITLSPQRMLLREDDLFKKDGTNELKFISVENSIDIKKFIPAIIFSVKIKKVILPGLQKMIFKISRKASVSVDNTDPSAKEVVVELQALRKLLYGPNDILRKADFVFKIMKKDTDITLKDFWTDGKVDDDEMVEIYSDGLSGLFNQGNSETAKDTVEADLLIFPRQQMIAQQFQSGFNLLLHKDPAQKVFIALDKHYNFRFNTSVNGFSNAMKVELNESGFVKTGNRIEPLLYDYSNFNKFRISVKNGEELKLNTTDALIPICETGAGVIPQQFYYRSTHRFAEEVNAKENDDNQENRYKLYRLNVAPLVLKGKIENQYGFRLALEMNDLQFPFSNPIRNLGDLTTTAIVDDQVSTYPLLTYTISDNNDKLALTFNKRYLQKLLRQTGSTGAAQTTAYRTLYEAVFDALHNQCELIIELWNFNNTLHSLDAEVAAHPETSREWPSLMKHLEKQKTLTIPVDFQLVLQSFNQPSYKEFKEAINKYLDGINTLSITFNLTNAAEIKNTNLIRLGLLIRRSDNKTIRQQFPMGDPKSEDLKPFPLGDEDDTSTSFAFTRTEIARAALKSYLDNAVGNNTLFTSFSYVSTEWYDLNNPGNTTAEMRKNIKELLGETTSFIWRPHGLAPNKTDMLLYYVPYSFQPLRVHQELLDMKTTIGFTEYLLRILNYLAYPEKQKEDPTAFLVDIEVNNDQDTLFKTKLHVRDKILPAIAEKIAALLTYVDNRPDTFDDEHYRLVSVISKRIAAGLLKAFKSVLIEDPLKYITAKGFGVGLFSGVSAQHLNSRTALPADGEMRDLYMLQLIKDIRKPVPGSELKSNDITQINFKSFLEETAAGTTVTDRYFIETLEDALYDNEFQISEQKEAQSVPFQASQVRTAEDLLENQNRFNEQGVGKTGKLPVKHYCPDWVTQQNDKFYLLPSRTPPVTPVPYISSCVKVLKNSVDDWEELVVKPSGIISLNFSPHDPDVEFKSKGIAYNKQLDDIKKKFWSRWDIFINTYDFIIEPDEEAGIENDLFEFHFNDVNAVAAAVSVKTSDEKEITVSDIFKQFEHYVRKKKGDITSIPMNKLVPLDGTTGVIEDFLHKLIIPGSQTDNEIIADIRLRQLNSDKFEITFSSNFALKERVLSAEVFRVKDAPPDQRVKHVIRLKVLADPWSHYQCRLRVRRNMRDMDNDGRFDINPVFVMNSTFSTWVDYGIQSLHYDYLSSLEDATGWDPALKYLEPSALHYQAYKDLILTNKPIPFGNLLLQHLKNNDTLFAGTEMTKQARLFNSYIEQKIRPAAAQLFHPDKDVSIIREYKKRATDRFAKAGILKIAGNTIHQFEVTPDGMSSTEPILHCMWYSIEDPTKEVFSIALRLKLKQV